MTFPRTIKYLVVNESSAIITRSARGTKKPPLRSGFSAPADGVRPERHTKRKEIAMPERESPFVTESAAYDSTGACLAEPTSAPNQRADALAVIAQRADALESSLTANGVDLDSAQMKSCEDEDDTCCGRNQGSYYC